MRACGAVVARLLCNDPFPLRAKASTENRARQQEVASSKRVNQVAIQAVVPFTLHRAKQKLGFLLGNLARSIMGGCTPYNPRI